MSSTSRTIRDCGDAGPPNTRFSSQIAVWKPQKDKRLPSGETDREERWHHPQTIEHRTDTRSKLIFWELPGQMEGRRQVHLVGEMAVQTRRHNWSVALTFSAIVSVTTNGSPSGTQIIGSIFATAPSGGAVLLPKSTVVCARDKAASCNKESLTKSKM